MSDLRALTLTEAKNALEKGDFTSEELTQAYVQAMDKGKGLNAYITQTADKAVEMAKASDQRRAQGHAGLIEGVPLAIKDLFCTSGINTTAASRILENFVPSYESTVTQNLWTQGAVLLGKTNQDEFAMGSSNESSAFGPVVNPWTPKGETALVPGGSSGGSSAAVAGRLAVAALGTDTGGSIRQPASFTGIVGLKPTYGRCSRWGTIAFASSLDQAGPMTRTVEDSALLLQAMAGYDAKDSTSVPVDVPDYRARLGQSLKGLKIGIPQEYRIEGISSEIQKLWDDGVERLKKAGAEIVSISLPNTQHALATYYIIAPAEASSNLSRYDGVRYGKRVIDTGDSLDQMYAKTRGAGFGLEVKRRIMMGAHVLSAGYYDAYYNKARQVRSLIADDFKKAYTQVDAILTPTSPSPAFRQGETVDPVQMYLNDVFTVPASLAGLPAISVPAGLSEEGLPLGLQLIGKPFEETELLQIAQTLEQIELSLLTGPQAV